MEEMMALEEERVERMTERPAGDVVLQMGAEGSGEGGGGTAEDEGIVRRELNKADPSGMSACPVAGQAVVCFAPRDPG